jgi:hypothetical protein
MYCPQCGTESSSGLQYCRSCGANLKVIGKAVTLSETIARIPGPLPHMITGMIKNLKADHVSEEISHAMEEMKKEIVRSSDDPTPDKPWWLEGRKKKTAQQRREKHLIGGTISLFSGIGLAIFLYYLTGALVLKLPPDFVAKVPFEIEPVVRILWLVGLLPMLSGLGHIVAGLLIRPDKDRAGLDETARPLLETRGEPVRPTTPASVTERTTNLLERDMRRGAEMSDKL